MNSTAIRSVAMADSVDDFTMTMSRAVWNYTYEKGLVDTLKEHVNIPMFKAQNGWTPEGWKSITAKFNDKFPLAHFTKQQVQEKEKELKGNYKILWDAKKNSGAGWNESLGMLIAKPKIWEQMIQDNSKVGKFRKKPFPLFNDLAELHDGNVATGDLNFTSTERHVNPTIDPLPKQSCSEQSTQNTLGINFVGTNPFAQAEVTEAQSTPSNLNIEDQVGGSGTGKKRKQKQLQSELSDFLGMKRNQFKKSMEKLDEKRKIEEDFSVEKRIDAVDAIEELTDEQKANANELWQSDMNRQIFMKTKNINVRLIWLKKKISQKTVFC